MAAHARRMAEKQRALARRIEEEEEAHLRRMAEKEEEHARRMAEGDLQLQPCVLDEEARYQLHREEVVQAHREHRETEEREHRERMAEDKLLRRAFEEHRFHMEEAHQRRMAEEEGAHRLRMEEDEQEHLRSIVAAHRAGRLGMEDAHRVRREEEEQAHLRRMAEVRRAHLLLMTLEQEAHQPVGEEEEIQWRRAPEVQAHARRRAEEEELRLHRAKVDVEEAAGRGAPPQQCRDAEAELERRRNARMQIGLLSNARDGNHQQVSLLGDNDLFGTTPSGNTCLHIASIYGRVEFCNALLERQQVSDSLLSKPNLDGETPLVAAVRSGSVEVADALLTACAGRNLWEAVVKPDKDGCNALHHAIRGGHDALAMRLCAGTQPDDAVGTVGWIPSIRRFLWCRGGQQQDHPPAAAAVGQQEQQQDPPPPPPVGQQEPPAPDPIQIQVFLSECASELSKQVNNYDESPMFAAAIRNSLHVVRQLLDIPDSRDGGPFGNNALHAAVRSGNEEIARIIVAARPLLAREFHSDVYTPVCMAVTNNMVGMLKVFLDSDPSLGYEKTGDGHTLLQIASYDGHVAIARELLTHCPDAPCRGTNADGRTCLHTAVLYDHTDFVKFILSVPQLGKIINMQNKDGQTALHLAVKKCNPDIVEVLLSDQHIDATVLDNRGTAPVWVLSRLPTRELSKTLNWNRVLSHIHKADPRGTPSINNLRAHMSRLAIENSRDNVQQLAQRYMTNTSLVAILITTITFAAAFTLPGGYNSKGLPNMARKPAFVAFLISDTLAMCSSFVGAFACIIARWEDYDYLIYYKSMTQYIMAFAYTATTIAFSTGLYTVVVTYLHWLTILSFALLASFPIITWLVVKLPILKLKIQLGEPFYSNLLDMV